MIKAKVENYLKYPMVPIEKDSLFNSAKQLYFTGHLKDKNDLFVIHYLIKESSPLNTAIEPFNEFIHNLSTETAYDALAFLINTHPNFFKLNFFLICEKLLITYGDSPYPILQNEQIVALFMNQSHGFNDISLLTTNLLNKELPMNVVNVVFEAFLSNPKTSGLLKKSVIEQAGFIIVGNKPITPSKMFFLSHAIESISDKLIAFSRLETLKAIHPEVAAIPQFIELEARITAQKAAEVARDPEKKAIDEHTGGLWRCISRYPDPSGVGYLYEFMLKPEYKDASRMKAKLDAIYPADESMPKDAILNFNCPPGDKKEDLVKFFNALGYSSRQQEHNVFMTLPDREALLHRYETFSKEHKDKKLPELSITSSPGIASDLDFVRALIQYDALLFTGKEFVHDHNAHITSIFICIHIGTDHFNALKRSKINNYNYYYKLLCRVREEVEKPESTVIPSDKMAVIKHYLPIFEALLGAEVDVTSALIEPSNFRLSFILKSAKWINYFKKVFSGTDGGPVFNDGNVAQIRELAIYIENLDIRS
jgi:hypothetical protein